MTKFECLGDRLRRQGAVLAKVREDPAACLPKVVLVRPDNNDLSNLVTLCNLCHAHKHRPAAPAETVQ